MKQFTFWAEIPIEITCRRFHGDLSVGLPPGVEIVNVVIPDIMEYLGQHYKQEIEDEAMEALDE